MAKKGNEGKKEQKSEKTGKKGGYKLIILGVFVLAAGVGVGIALTGGAGDDYPKALGGEMRNTLSPGYFFGTTAKAYQAAKEIPDILDGIYCHCHCQKNFGHKSLLSCYVDRHGAQCGVCIDEAVMAYDLYKKGAKKKDIIHEVNSHFAKKMKKRHQ